MSREQRTAQVEGDVDQDAATESRGDPALQGMPPGLQHQVIAIPPGDVDRLAALLKIHRGLYDRQILLLAARTPHLGNSMVQRAIALSQQRQVQDTAPGVLGDQVRKGGAFELDAASPAGRAPALRPDEVHHGGEFDPFGREPEPSWVAGARSYNASHTQLVAEFNDLTDHACTSGDHQVDPQSVSTWQAARGVAADGRVGPQTLASARALKAKGPKTGAAPAGAAAAEGAPAVAAMHEHARAFNAAHADLVRAFNELTSYFCFDFARDELVPGEVAKWQMQHGEPADGMVTPETVAAAKLARAKHPESEESSTVGHASEVAPEEAWKPSTTKTETKLTGSYGDYAVKHGFAYDPSDGWSYEVEITMTVNDQAKADQIGWIQTVRRSKGASSGWATGKTDQGMTDERAKRTDAKTGFRVDRSSAPDKKTPFYGMDKGSDGKLSAASNAKVGKHGGTNPYLYDGPGLYDKDELEFVSTATDMATGTQYDAVHWGAKYDKAGKIASETTPSLIKAGDELLAGRDRAIHKWNTDVAGGDIDKVPTTADPAAQATALAGKLGGASPDGAAVAAELAAVTDGDLRKRIQACYKLETGRSLADDLRAHLSKDQLAGLASWL